MSARESTSGIEIYVRAWPALARTFLAVRGSLDFETRVRLLEDTHHALELGHEITLDASEITAIDAAGAQAIRDCIELAARCGTELTVQDPSPAVRHALRHG
jgi:anti-anti-sigma regulatory factor